MDTKTNDEGQFPELPFARSWYIKQKQDHDHWNIGQGLVRKRNLRVSHDFSKSLPFANIDFGLW